MRTLVNNILSESTVTPEVGMGATLCFFSDRVPATIIEIRSPKTIVVQTDNYVRTDSNGMSDCQTYDYSPDPNGAIRVFTKRKNGRWVLKGNSMDNGLRLSVGHRNRYYDFTF